MTTNTKARVTLGLIALAIFGSACATVPPPSVLAEADRVRQSPAASEAKEYAPQAYAHAEKLEREANVAFAAKDYAGAQILGEHAIAAYAHADALARVARAEDRSNKSETEATGVDAELARIASDQTRVGAEVDALELKVKVTRDAQSIVPSSSATPAREKARLAAAKALALQARLLCTAARLLLADRAEATPAAPASATPAPAATSGAAPSAPTEPPLAAQLKDAEDGLGKLDASLTPAPSAAPIDGATRARAACLSVLTRVRRGAAPIAKAPGAGDALLGELSATGTLAPSRDDRGVVVTLRGVFSGNALTSAGEARFAELGRVAAAHPDFPVELVIHEDKAGAKDLEASRARADVAIKALKTAGAKHVESTLAGNALPVVDPTGADRARNARAEIVFVTPEAL